MPSSLRLIIFKELKELLRDPKILIGMVLMPVLILPLMGGAMSLSQEAVEKELAQASIGVWDRDFSEASSSLINFLNQQNQKVISVSAVDEAEAVEALLETNAKILLEIPDGYGENISRGELGTLHIYALIKSLGIAESVGGSMIEGVVNTYRYVLSIEKIRELLLQAGQTEMDPRRVYYPFSVRYSSVIKGNVVDIPPQTIFQLTMSQGVSLPMMTMMLLIFSMQIAATSIAVEKEEKTLETLMTLPVGRLTILTGKLAGSTIVALAGAVAYIVGFSFYMNTAFGFVPGEVIDANLSDIGLTIGPEGLLLLGVTMFVTLISGLALALSVAVFTDSVRGAQSLVGVMVMPVIIPSLILMFTDLNMLPLPIQIVLYAIPYTHSSLASKVIFMGDYLTVIRSIIYITLFTVFVLYIAAKIFSSERVITARIRTKRLRIFQRKRDQY